MAVRIARRNDILSVRAPNRRIRMDVPASSVDEAFSLLKHAATYYVENESGANRKRRVKAAEEVAVDESAAKKAAKAEKAKKKIRFNIQQADGTKMGTLEYLVSLIEGTTKQRYSHEKAIAELAAYGSSKSAQKNRAAAEAAITGLVRTRRLRLLDDKLHVYEKDAEGTASATGTDE